MIILETAFWLLIGLVVYVYVGYPMLLAALRLVAGPKPVDRGDSLPAVTLIISAYNERDVIGSKIENSLALDYPREQLEILVVSDASDDGTDEMVHGFAGRGVRLLRMQERGGKTVGLNAAVSSARGDVLVFSDANAMYKTNAIRALVRNFEDPNVGVAVGESTYSDTATQSEQSESTYWSYETAIKRLETQIGSTVGGDGAIYAVRKQCYRSMPSDALSDFVNPLQAVGQGLRCIYEPEAVSVEKAAGTFAKEFRRKVRIVNRAWRAMLSMKYLLNPFEYGVFSWELISHKVLRWLVPFFLVAALTINLALVKQHPVYQVLLALQLLFYAIAVLGGVLKGRKALPRVLYLPFYFCLVNAACILGIFEAYGGKTYTTWSTARQTTD